MALRKIRTFGDPVLGKVAKPVPEINEKIKELAYDMLDTMYTANGVGLAAPQIGVLRRLFIMDTGDGLKECINPKILERKGTQECVEGCLSSPGEYGLIHRPKVVKFQAQNRNGKFFVSTVEGLAAECVEHECDHLDGVIFIDKVERMLAPDELK